MKIETLSENYCKSTGLAMFGSEFTPYNLYEMFKEHWLSKDRCVKCGKPVKENEKPIAFYKVNMGYIGLYER